MADAASRYIEEKFPEFLDRLGALVRIPSISDWPQNQQHVLACAEAAKGELDRIGMKNTQLLHLNSGGSGKFVPPLVFGEWTGIEGQPTILLYAHYDVQPPGVENLWNSPPFEPTTRQNAEHGGERMYGRGSADDKAGIMAFVGALESVLKTTGTLPINVKIIFEGEEEIGSIHLEQYLQQHFDLLKADVLVLGDTGNFDIGVPSLTYSLRGIVGLDVELRTVDHSVHSGMWGGVLMDALTSMCKLISTLHDAEGRVAVPGFYDGVRQPSEREVQNIKSLGYTEEKLRKESGLLDGVNVIGSAQQGILERIWLQPALNVIGIDSCNLNVAANKILPSAKARLSCRIVANQDPTKVLESLKAHLSAHVPYGAKIVFSNEESLKPWVCVPEGAVFAAAERAMRTGFGRNCVYTGCGGSIGFVEPFANAFGGAPAILIGVEDPYTNAHGENESLLISDFKKSMLSMLHLFFELKK